MSNVFTLQNSINFALPFVQYVPVNSGLGQEPAVSIANLIRNSFLSAPQNWAFNRNEITFSTTAGTQDYAQSFSGNGNDFGYIEKATLTDDQGNVFEIKDVYNSEPLSVTSFQQRPFAISAEKIYTSGGNQFVSFRFHGVPKYIYTVTVTYQKLAPQFGPFFITSCGNAAAGNTTYTGTFDPYSLPTGATATITGFVMNLVNNGTFTIVSCSATSLVLANASGVSEAVSAYAVNPSWSPLPDQFSDVYNWLFLSEVLAQDDDARSQIYRQRGIGSFLAKATGLSEMQKNVFVQQWMRRSANQLTMQQTTSQGNQGRGI
jgi:hypothetical protein